ncbi:uncharacterized protein BDV14DRAFT_198219 [Aspergillus stella-maris]|uniref:uncharacterized protein n=1 Tax=Aspergillus stella-maris TaxID=1810926 RepID=UPI003CCCB291
MAATHPKHAGFDIIPTTFKHVGEHDIRVDVLVPQKAAPGKRPVIVRFHGGGLLMGDSLYADFWPHWLSDLALQHNAIVISPNYRFMPQATGLEIWSDVEDFWTWLRSGAVESLLESHSTPTEPDLDRVLLAGESAGGLLSVNAGLAYPDDVRAITALYPALNPADKDFAEPRTEVFPFNTRTPESTIRKVLSSAPSGPISSAVEPQYLPLMLAAIEHGKIGPWYVRGSVGEEAKERLDDLFPGRRLETPGVKIPKGGIMIIQGAQDSVVPPGHSEPFVKRAKEVFRGQEGGDKISLVLRDGEHGFDGDLRYHEEEWLREALKTAVEAWLE